MNPLRAFALALLACASVVVRAQPANTIFNDSFSGDALDASTYPAVTSTTTGWDVLSGKSAPAPTNTSGLTINMASTSSGFVEAQARFASAPIQLLPGTYVDLTATFVPTNVMVHSSDTLTVGLFNSGGSAPDAGLLSSGLTSSGTAYATGGAQGWAGYNGYIPFTGGAAKMGTRAAQVGTNNLNQDVLFGPQSTSSGYNNPAAKQIGTTPSVSAVFTNGAVYTLDYRIALSSDGLSLSITYSLYNGAGTTGTGANTLIGAYTNTATATAGTFLQNPPLFDAMAIGWRADASLVSNLNFSSIVLTTTGGKPWFTQQAPAHLLLSVGSSVTLSTTVGGAATYQWQKSTDGGATFANIDTTANASAATAALSFSSIQLSDAGVYRLVASNSLGSTTGSNTTLAVTTSPVAPSITTNPTGGTILVGSPFAFTVAAYGTDPLSYQWSKSTDGGVTYAPIAGATAASYALSSAALADSGVYEVTVANSAGTATSTPVTLAVDQAPSITTQPVGAVLTPGSTYTLAVAATGTPPPSYQWYLNGTLIPGATSASYTIGSASGANTGNYTVVVSSTVGGSVTSSIASVAVVSPGLAVTATTPAAGGSGVLPDTRLTLTFNQPIAVGVSGQIRIYDASNPATPVDTVDLVSGTALMNTLRAASTVSTLPWPVQTKVIGGQSTPFNYYPVTISGNTATIYPRNNVLAYGKTYYVTVDPGVFTDSTGLAYAGISGNAAWKFATKSAGPAAGTTRLVVAADGSGDFCTVQGALDFLPNGNTTPTTLFIRKGTYFEEIYFTGKHDITFLGEDRNQTAIEYPNNNTFNNASGTYHRMVLQGDHVNNIAVVNLTVENSTAHGGSQAESLLLNGTATAQAIVTQVNLVSYQDTLQINGQAYISDSHISGDVDFMWGDGPNYFNNCELTALTSAGFYTQIRNAQPSGTTNHGNVYLNCTFDAAAGVSGSYLARIDPTQFPYSEVVILNSALTNTLNATGWLLNNATTAPNVRWWYSGLTNAGGATAFNTSTWQYAMPVPDSATLANYENPTYVLGNNWVPTLAPIILTQPVATTVPQGQTLKLAVVAAGVPEPTYQWFMNHAPLTDGVQTDGSIVSGSATANLTIQNVAADESAAGFTVSVTNASGTVTSSSAALTVIAPLPNFTTQPSAQTAAVGSSVTFSAAVTGASSFQWYFNGAAVSGATSPSLTVNAVTPLSAGVYTLVATNSSGNEPSAPAILNVTAASGQPTLPVIPNGVFNVTDFGAVGDGSTDNTAAIQQAVNAALAAGGGTVEVPAAASPYLCGPITLGSAISLQVDAGAMLQALPYGIYPDTNNSPAHFISVKNATNVQVVGGGTIDGNGSAWWTAYNANKSLSRPRVLQITNCTDVLIAGATFANGPTEHVSFDSSSNVTIDGITVSAASTSPNTDGIDPAGSNFLIENCSISDGDDNIAVKPQKVLCTNIVITGCAFGSGHGLSVGGQTNAGLNGMTVTNCTFNGTSTGLRLKADSTEGGLVQNITYSNITMTNVPYPIVFYSYYNQVGTPGAVSGSSQTTPAKVNTWNSSPPNSLATTTIPGWTNITISNLTATGATGYSTVWGLPLANGLISSLTLNNVNISGGAGFEIYDAANVQVTGSSNLGTYVTDNALAIVGQPQAAQTISAGQSAVFAATVAGASGVNGTAPTYQWNFNGSPLTEGVQADGSVVTGSTTTTLTISNARIGDSGSYTLTASDTLDGYDVTAGALAPNSLPVTGTSSAATLTVKVAAATVTLSNLHQTYSGLAEMPTVTTAPAGLPVTITYNGASAAPVNAGSYTVVATLSDPSFTGSDTDTLVIAPATADVAVQGYTGIYDAKPHGASGTATGVGGVDLSADLTLGGTFTDVPGGTANWAFHDPAGNYSDASGSVPVVIGKANPTIAVTGYTVTYDAVSHVATGTATGVSGEPLAGLDLSRTAHTDAGTYSDPWTFAAPNIDYNNTSGTVTDVIAKAKAIITVDGYNVPYDGQPHTATGTVTGVGGVSLSGLDLSGTRHVLPGSYNDTWTFAGTNDYQSAQGQVTDIISVTALIRHGITLEGSIEGSVQVLTGENDLLDGKATISGDLLVPGTPNVLVGGASVYGGTVDYLGSASPSDYTVTLSGAAVLRHVGRRVDPLALPVVAAPPVGTQNVTVTNGATALAAGTFGQVTVSGKGALTLGVAGATTPSVYNFQSLAVSGKGQVQVVGPVVLTVNADVTVSGSAGVQAHPDWLNLQIASGGLTLSGQAQFFGNVLAPSDGQGAVTISGGATLHGQVSADTLSVSGGGVLIEP